jgi:hypothetical protein
MPDRWTALATLAPMAFVRVPEHHVGLVERRGRYHRTIRSGRHFLGLVDEVRVTLDLRPQSITITTPVISENDEMAEVTVVVTYDITDPVRAVYELTDHRQALEQTVILGLRNYGALHDLDQIAAGGAEMSRFVLSTVGELSPRFGCRPTRVDVTAIERIVDLEAFRRDSLAEDLNRILDLTDVPIVLRGYDRGPALELLESARRALLSGDRDGLAAVDEALRRPVPVRFRGYDCGLLDVRLRRLRRFVEAERARTGEG